MSDMRFHIEIEVDNVDSDERMVAMTEAVRIGARQIFAAGMFICGENPKPKITVWCENMRDGTTAIGLAEEETG